ncbi:MAG TPA: galactokinase family protein [bacterium]|nr:galactokinase family protein [bacterium]
MKASEKNALSGKSIRKLDELLKFYISRFGDTDVNVFRIPARINLLGTHVEHRGGYVNYLTIDKELLCVAGKRKDRQIRYCNLDKQYECGQFSLESEMACAGTEWIEFIRKAKIVQGEWVNYIKAPILYIQNRYDKPLSGMNLAFYGEIPVGSGLSSSSAVVVATAMAFCNINSLGIEKGSLALMSGEAEWYVGTRGGSGDHAAMLFGRENQIAHMRFFPLTCEYLPFPENYRIISCNSMIKAKKTAGAKNMFNERIAAYDLGLRIIKKNFPEIAEKLQYLRDINPQNLGSEDIVYEILLSLPETVSRKGIKEFLPGEDMSFLFESHSEPEGGYRLRDAVLYGISECERSRICSEFLHKGDIDNFGRLMFISHDGDRVSSHTPDGKTGKWNYTVSDEYLKSLKEDLKSGIHSKRKNGSLYLQPGAYGCSIEELDLIVDIARDIKGVKGAKLTGAGLGGSVLILVEKDETEKVIDVLNSKYYRPKGFQESAFVCKSVNGADEI